MYVPPPIKKPRKFRAPNPGKQDSHFQRPDVSIEAKDVLFTLISEEDARHTPSLTVTVENETFHVVPRPFLYEFMMFLDSRTWASIYTTMRREHIKAILDAISSYIFAKSEELRSLDCIIPTIYDIKQCLVTAKGPEKSLIYMSEHYELTPMSRLWMIDLEEGLVDLAERKIVIPKFTGDCSDRGLIDFIIQYGS